MSDEIKDNEKEELTQSQGTDVGVTVSYTSEPLVVTGKLADILLPKPMTFYSGFYIKKEGKPNSGEEYDFRYEPLDKSPYGLSDIRNMYANNGGDVEAIQNEMKQYIMDNADNDAALASFLSSLSGDFMVNLYDMNKNHKSQGNSALEMLKTILSVPEGQQLDGFVCSNIHEYGLRLLHECGREAVILSGDFKGLGNHATLLYKNSNGKYTYINYGKAIEIDAPSIKEAALTITNASSDVYTNGFISFTTEDGSYQEFSLKDEAVWGEMLDKRAYNSQSIFRRDMSLKSGMDAQFNYSNQGNMSAELSVTRVYTGDNSIGNFGVAVGGREGKSTDVSYKALGIKADWKQINKAGDNAVYFGATGVVDYTSRVTNGREVLSSYTNQESMDASIQNLIPMLREKGYTDSEIAEAIARNNKAHVETRYDISPDKKHDYLTGFIRGVAGIETPLYHTNKQSVKNVAQASLTGVANLGFPVENSLEADYRIALEDGIQQSNTFATSTLTNEFSGGLLIDNRQTLGAQNHSVELGAKFNAGSSFYAHPSQNLSYGAGVSAYSVFTKPSTDYGGEVNGFITYKPEGSGITYSANAGAQFEYQRLHLGGINETTENKTSLNFMLSAQKKKNTFTLGCSRDINHINNTRNQTNFFVGYKRAF